MSSLGGNFTIMLMVCIPESNAVVQKKLKQICDELDYFFHLKTIE
jgi:hypothetical protein